MGIGIITEMPELGSLSRQEIASLAGVAPKTESSGKKTFASHIRGGRFYVRKACVWPLLLLVGF